MVGPWSPKPMTRVRFLPPLPAKWKHVENFAFATQILSISWVFFFWCRGRIGYNIFMGAIQSEVTIEKAEDIYKKYVRLLHDLIFVRNNKFDVVFGPADSGVFMAKTVEMLYKIEGVSAIPKVLVLPIQRYEHPCSDTGEPFENISNKSLVEHLKSELAVFKEVNNVLFVDDEISSEALTAKAVLKLLLKVEEKVNPNNLIYTIIAENHGFQWKYDVPASEGFVPLPIRYYAYGNKQRWYDFDKKQEYHANGTVFSVMPDDIFSKYKGRYNLICKNKDFAKKHLISLFLDGRIKVSKEGVLVLSHDLLTEVQSRTESFEEDRTRFIDKVENLVRKAIE